MKGEKMNILVLNGSPKGDLSITLQYVAYLQKAFASHTFKIEHIAQRIKRLERDPAAFEAILGEVRATDLVLWATPVYYFLVPGQVKRFIELVDERGASEAFAGRYAAVLTTSIHFFDHIAHSYLAGICEDWQMHFYGGHSAEFKDLLDEAGRAQLMRFAEGLFAAVEQAAVTPGNYAPVIPHEFVYVPGTEHAAADLPRLTVNPGRELRPLIIVDGLDRSPNLARMVKRLAASFDRPVQVVDLAAVDIKAGCLGCLKCGLDNECQFEGKDDFTNLFRDQVMTADLLFFAGDIRDRYLSARWKTFFDRSFFRGHAPSLTEKQLAWIVTGPLRQLPNLGQFMQAYTEMHQANLLGIVSDEYADSSQIDALLDDLALRGVAWTASGYQRPNSFLGVGGHKLFRDRIWSDLRFIFQADHRRYQATGTYDFPQGQIALRVTNLFAPVIRLPFIRKQFVPRITEVSVQPFRRLVEAP
jgi:multimeric flavodoxin WrbA